MTVASGEGSDDGTARAKTCFIIMPISTPSQVVGQYGGDAAHFRHVLEALLIPAVKAAGFEPIEPTAGGSDVIQSHVIRQLQDADLVLCDLSTLNANVLFELGVRIALNRPVCLIRDSTVDLGRIFDLSIVQAPSYDEELRAYHIDDDVRALANHIAESYDRDPNGNAFWRGFGIQAAAVVGAEASGDAFQETVLLRLDTIERRLREQILPAREPAAIRRSTESLINRSIAVRLFDVLARQKVPEITPSLVFDSDRGYYVLEADEFPSPETQRVLESIAEDCGLKIDRYFQRFDPNQP